jgi:pimeloyl-ACP methyl ester carboxylesterase
MMTPLLSEKPRPVLRSAWEAIKQIPREAAEDKGWWNDPWQEVKDLRVGAEFMVAGMFFLHGKNEARQYAKEHPPLQDVPNVKLARPLMLVPGWNTETSKWSHLTDKLLASGLNGSQAYYLKEGAAYADPECTQRLEKLPPDAKILVNVWDSEVSPPDVTALQLEQNTQLLGDAKCDVIAYSMGGLATRKYLSNGGDNVGKLMLLGSPSQGTRFAQMAGHIIKRDMQWAMGFAGMTVADLPAMEWLAAGSPQLQQLNAEWPAQQAALEGALIVGSNPYLTPSTTGFAGLAKGDGMVETSSLPLSTTPTRVLEGEGFLQHGVLPHDSNVYRELTGFFECETVGS